MARYANCRLLWQQGQAVDSSKQRRHQQRKSLPVSMLLFATMNDSLAVSRDTGRASACAGLNAGSYKASDGKG